MLYYSRSTNGFYDDDIHGERQIRVPDPAWVPPDGSAEEAAPLVAIDNPDCKLPADAVEITPELHKALMQAQSEGKLIRPDADGNPEAVERPAYIPTTKDQIAALEAQQTPRRIREFALGEDNGWLKNLDAEIAALRAKL